MKIILLGDPIPKLRARYSSRGKFVTTYDPQEKIKQQTRKQIAEQVVQLSTDHPMEMLQICNGRAFSVELAFYLPISQSDPQFKRNAKLWGFLQHNTRPDADNLSKYYLDCANGIIWQDDAQIVDLKSKKLYDLNPRTEITFMERKPQPLPENLKNILLCFKGEKEMKDFLRDARELGMYSLKQEPAPPDDVYLYNVASKLLEFCTLHADTIKNIKKRI